MLGSPFSPLKGVITKLIGVRKSIVLLGDMAAKSKETQAAEAEAGESEFERERRESDEASQLRKEEFAEEESKKYEEIQATNLQRDVDLADLWNDYYAAIRDKNWAERDRILNLIENYGK